MTVEVDDFNKEVECNYKGEHYSVRDKGSVMRHPRKEGRVRPNDNQWTFGSPNQKGYCQIASEVIHRIVAIAFHGEPPTPQLIVGHIDTNRQNNRPENLRWLTKLENALNNPITRKRIEYICGSIEAFVEDPSLLRNTDGGYTDIEWMRAVSFEEARNSWERLSEWAEEDNATSKGGKLGEWIFSPTSTEFTEHESHDYVVSLTPNAVQDNWETPCEFPCCPQEITEELIVKYAEQLSTEAVFSRNQYGESLVVKHAISESKDTLWVMCKSGKEFAIKPWSLAEIRYDNNLFIHKGLGSFFTEIGAEKQFTLAEGLEWTGEDSVDDYC